MLKPELTIGESEYIASRPHLKHVRKRKDGLVSISIVMTPEQEAELARTNRLMLRTRGVAVGIEKNVTLPSQKRYVQLFAGEPAILDQFLQYFKNE